MVEEVYHAEFCRAPIENSVATTPYGISIVTFS